MKFPSSDNLPSSSTKILSHFSIVLIRWAIMIVVLPFIALSRATWTFFWESSSKAEVASSRRRTLGLRMIVLAIATRYFWPPDNLPPLIPHWVSKPLWSSMSCKYFSRVSTLPSIATNSPFLSKSSFIFYITSSSSLYLASPIRSIIAFLLLIISLSRPTGLSSNFAKL